MEGGLLAVMNGSPVLHHRQERGRGWRSSSFSPPSLCLSPPLLSPASLSLSSPSPPAPPRPDRMSHRRAGSLDALRRRNVTYGLHHRRPASPPLLLSPPPPILPIHQPPSTPSIHPIHPSSSLHSQKGEEEEEADAAGGFRATQTVSQQLNTVHFNKTVKSNKSTQNASGRTNSCIIQVHSPKKGNKRLLKFLDCICGYFCLSMMEPVKMAVVKEVWTV